MNSYDVGIVGAGVVGCAIARELAHRYRTTPLRIIVLEKNEEVGEESSGRNSGVLHSGIHEQPFSLKERLAREGSALAVSYASQHGIPLLRTGMVIAISWDDIRRGLWRELSTLRRLWFNAWRTKTRVTVMTSSALRVWEPNLRACCGIVIPGVSVIDAHAFVHSLRTDAEANGVEFAFNNKVVGIEADAVDYILTTDRQRIRVACLINAAGLHADEIAALATHARNYTIRPLRGEYYEVVSANTKNLTERLVYPALPSHAAGKGIHFSPRPNGRLFVGPNAVRVEDKTDYTSRKTPPGLFVEALQKFLPALEERDLRWAYSGIRACVMTGNGGKSDFIIAADCEDPPLIDLVGIESPGLSAALAIARYVRELPCLQRRLNSLRP
ncbi:MAG TPA: FAD-dependent oxidoreductase [Nitrospiraceae bacterium]|nr:FAD-dependent oxidoreductase [Nitrospiraceae bacterium]